MSVCVCVCVCVCMCDQNDTCTLKKQTAYQTTAYTVTETHHQMRTLINLPPEGMDNIVNIYNWAFHGFSPKTTKDKEFYKLKNNITYMYVCNMHVCVYVCMYVCYMKLYVCMYVCNMHVTKIGAIPNTIM